MLIMPANQTNELVHLWAGRWPGSIGHLYTPARKERVRPWLPYALDNGRYAEATKGRPFDEAGFMAHVERYAWLEQRPLWLVVPDVPFDGEETVRWWDIWAPKLRQFSLPLALAVQDGMTPATVSALSPDMVFVGGSTEWKWATVSEWAQAFPRVHVGRVNSPEKLPYLESLGVESCDGSGWFRGKSPQIAGLASFLAGTRGVLSVGEAVAEAVSTRFHSNYSIQTTIHERTEPNQA